MPDELLLRLAATPTFEIPNVGLGDLSDRSETSLCSLREMASMSNRRRMARNGATLPDGSFPAATLAMLRTSLQAYTFAKNKPRVRRWLTRRAIAVGRPDVLPEAWGAAAQRSITASGANTHTGVMVALYPPANVASLLAGGGTDDEPVDELHVTLAYLGDSSELSDEDKRNLHKVVAAVAGMSEAMTATVQGFGSFSSEDGADPRWWSVNANGLAALRSVLVLGLESAGLPVRMEHDFTPHMTVRYGGEPLSEVPSGGGAEWPVDTIWLVVAGERTPFAFAQQSASDDADSVKVGEFAANNLETYWKSGKGAARIRWGTKGDFTRCDRLLAKHVGPRAKRICAQWHHDMNGFWPGDKRNNSLLDYEEGTRMGIEVDALLASAGELKEGFEFYWNPETDVAFRISTDSGTVEQFGDGAWSASDQTADAVRELPIVDDDDTLSAIVGSADTLDKVSSDAGRGFVIPIVIPEGIPSGDRRQFAKDSLEFKEPPIPVLWQRATDSGHDGSVTVGKITHIERLESGGLGNARGVFDTHADAIEAARQVREGFLTGVSGDVDQFVAEMSTDEEGAENYDIKHGRLVAATLVAKPAFQEATIKFAYADDEQRPIVASAGPLLPPAEWFTDPKLKQPTQLSVDDNGRVFGHIAPWDVPHAANPSLYPPHSRTDYKYFNKRPVRTSAGSDVYCGQLTLTGGHASLSLDADGAMAHYDNTDSAVADVVAGEDEFGIWVAGAMRPNVTDNQIRAFRASDPSGDWRVKPEGLELIAVCQVNVPGFPVVRPATLVASGTQMALVAAGVPHHDANYELRGIVASLFARVKDIETARESERRAEMLDTIASLRTE